MPAMGYLHDIDKFDASFFSYLPREATFLDPQHRLLLEGAWHAFENAGYNPEKIKETTGVFVGSSISSYLLNVLINDPQLAKDYFGIILHNDKDFLPTRISYKLNLKGPSMNVQTACSTSLAAVHIACNSIKAGECELALAGGIRVSVPEKQGYIFEEGGILSPDGHCRAFDKNAKGMVSGSGYGLVLLKSLDAALKCGDYIHASIKASAMNNDGMDKLGYTAPSINGQADVISKAFKQAKIAPESIGFLECHGTGTELGDPVEIAALSKVFNESTSKRNFIPIGSLKPNIGHLDVASGIASLIKSHPYP